MYLSPRTKRLLFAVPVACAVLAPGWSASLERLHYEQMWDQLKQADNAVGVSHVPVVGGEEWHATYVDDSLAGLFSSLNLRGFLPTFSPPDYVAHIPAGELHADAHYRVETHLRWPWWWPGGGVEWSAPR